MASLSKPSDTWWNRKSPDTKKKVVIGGFFVVVAIVVGPMFFGGDGSAPTKKKTPSIENILTGANTREMGLTGIAKELEDLRRTVKDMQGQQQGSPGVAPADAEKANQLAELRQQVEALTHRVDTTVAQPTLQTGTPTGIPPNAPAGTVWNNQTPTAPTTPPKPVRIYEIDSDSDVASRSRNSGQTDPRNAKAQAAATPKVYLPRGAMMQGVTITGLDAPTGRGSTQDPIPVLVRIKHEAILPNLYRADYRECFALLSGYGDLSSERAYLRSVGLSCVRQDGKVIDANIEMVAIGEDGKAGMRGRFVSKQGRAIAKAAAAGFAQSFAQAFRPQGGFGGFGGAGAISGDSAENGFYGGASSALDRVAKFEIDYANQMLPVVEVDAGRPVTLVVVRGTEMQLATN